MARRRDGIRPLYMSRMPWCLQMSLIHWTKPEYFTVTPSASFVTS